MAWLAVNKDGTETIFSKYPEKYDTYWMSQMLRLSTECPDCGYSYKEEFWFSIELPKGSIKKLIGKELTWEDEPVEI